MSDTKQNNIQDRTYEGMMEKRTLNENIDGFERGATNAWAGNKLETDDALQKNKMNDDIAKKNTNDIEKKSVSTDDVSKNYSSSASSQKGAEQNKPKEPESAPAEDHSLRNEILLNVGLTALSFIPVTAPFALATRAIIFARSAYGAAKAVSMGTSAARVGNAATEAISVTNISNKVNKITKIGDKAESKVADKIENKVADKIEDRTVSRVEQSSTKTTEKPDNKSNKSSLNRSKKERDRDGVDFDNSTKKYLDDERAIQEKGKKKDIIEAYGGGFAGLCALLQIISQSLDGIQGGTKNDNGNGLDMDSDINGRKMSSRTKGRLAMLGKAASTLSLAEMGANTLDDMQVAKDSLGDYDVLKSLQDADNKDSNTQNNNLQSNYQNISFNQNTENTTSVKM